MKKLIIIGVGGFAREVYWHAQSALGYNDQWIIKGFLDGDVKLPPVVYELLEAPLLGSIDTYQIAEDDVFVCAIADPQIKGKIVANMSKKKAKFINLIHKTALISPSARIGIGNIFCPFTFISSNVNVENFVVINVYSSLGHDACIGSYSSVMAHVDITGSVIIEEGVFFGSGARALPKSKIGAYSKIGAGSVVLKKVKAHQTVFGNPAMPI